MTPYLQIDKLSKRFGALELFSDLSFVLGKGEKAGLIAPNGSGKTTLLRIIAGEESKDSGDIIFRNGLRCAYLPQQADFRSYPNILSACLSQVRPELRDVIEAYETATKQGDADRITALLPAMEAAQAWQTEQELTALLSRLQLHDPLRPTQKLSGGESKRISLAAALLGQPDLLILDEPTNHLDPDVIEWLEDYLLSLSNTSVLMVTHDRYFLDRICDTILELDAGQLYSYHANYSQYLIKRDERIAAMQQEEEKLKNLYRREIDWMRRMPQARGTKAKYRKDAFYQTEDRLQTLSSYSVSTGPRLEAQDVYIGKKTCVLKNISKRFGDRNILNPFSYTFARRERLGIIGPNGAGKSTLLKIILGTLAPDSGEIEIGETVQFGYFAQQPFAFPPDKKVIDVITDKAEKISFPDGTTITAMQLLTRFLFPPARQQDYVSKLSGGELRRLQLCTVLMENPNFLILDEPTNDLDIPTLQVLEDYLSDFPGCLLIASHDRFFMDRLAEHLFVLKGDGSIRDFPGAYTLYLDQREAEEAEAAALRQEERQLAQKAAGEKKKTSAPAEKKKKLSYKEQKELDELNVTLAQLESDLKELEQQLSSGQLQSDALLEATERYGQLKKELDSKELRWLELSDI